MRQQDQDHDLIELEPATGYRPKADRRARVPEPLPVRLVAVDDVTLPAAAGLERDLDAFYVALLKFERDAADLEHLIYRADNFRLRFDVVEGPVRRESLRPAGIEVPSLAALEGVLVATERPYVRQKGLAPGQQSLALLDPAGNWIEVVEMRGL